MLKKLFSSKIRYKILDYFLKEKDKEVYPAYLSGLINEDAGNVSRELQKLVNSGFLKVVRKHQKNIYSLSRKHGHIYHLERLFQLEDKEKKEEWLVMEDVQSGINPTLTYSYINSTYIEKLFKNIGIKSTPKKYMVIFNHGGYQLCFPKENYNFCSKAVLQMIIDSPEKGIKLNKELLQKSDDFLDFAEKARKMNLGKLSDNRLIKLLEDFYHKQTLMHTMGWIGNVVDFVDSAFSSYLLKHLKNQGEVFSTLTTPLEESFAQKEYLNYLKVLNEIKKNKKIYRTFKENEARFIFDKLSVKFQKLIKQQVEKFGWLGYGVEGPGWKENYYVDLLASLIRQRANPVLLAKKIKLEQEETSKKQKKLIKSLKIDLKHQKLFEVAKGFVFTKGYRKDAMFHGFWCLEFLHREFAKRTNLALKQVRYIYPWEYKKTMVQKEKWSAELNKRWDHHLSYSEKGKHKVLSGEKAKRFVNSLNFEEKKVRKTRKLEGDCASPGKVRGVVVIINTPAENKKIEKADVLVSSMTNPELMPAIRKAKAIVTDIGGLTCHAAIVSREFGIPCIIGTKIASQVLKDGSIVEVDATHGVVNVIKR